MATYRTGNHWGVTIVREGAFPEGEHDPASDQLVAVVVNGDQALAERICALLNGDDRDPDMDAMIAMQNWDAHEHNEPADSCTCVYRPNGGPDPACIVHQGRRARGPKPPPLGPGCICDGSGRTCPRHGAVM